MGAVGVAVAVAVRVGVGVISTGRSSVRASKSLGSERGWSHCRCSDRWRPGRRPEHTRAIRAYPEQERTGRVVGQRVDWIVARAVERDRAQVLAVARIERIDGAGIQGPREV